MTPAIPQPPDKCPACGAKVQFTRHGKLSSEQVLFFECGFMWHNESDGSVWNNKECTRSFSAAIALRQKLADENTANECLQDELTVLCAELTAARARLAELQARDNASAMIRVVDAVLHLQECNNLRGPDPYCENCDGEGGAMLGGGCGDCWASDIYEAENNLSVAVAALPKDWRRIETQIVVADL